MNELDTRDMINSYLKKTFYKIISLQEQHVQKLTDTSLSRTEIHTIEVINDLETPILTSVADELKITKATASVCIDRLVMKKLVKKKSFKADKRKHFLSLTEKGKYYNEQHKDFHDKMVDAFINDLKIGEHKELLDGLKSLSEFLETYDGG